MRKGAFASPTNTSLPQKKSRAARGQEAIKYAKMQRQLEQLTRERDEAKAQAIVTQLVAEDYVLDADLEVKKFARLSDEERQEREDWIRKYGRKAPTGHYGPVSRRDTPKGGPVDLEEDPESIPPGDLEKAIQYQREHRLFDAEIAELAALAMPEKYGRDRGAQRNGGRNGHPRRGGE